MKTKIEELADGYLGCNKILTAIGDQTRQYLIIEMMKMGKCEGVRVNEITACTNLSRPAVSHHLQILKDAGLISVRKEGTKNYYYFNHDKKALLQLRNVLDQSIQILNMLESED